MMISSNNWSGIVPPQYIFSKRKFKCVVLDPPDFNPGSWIGAGDVMFDSEHEEFWMVVRHRRAPPLRGYELGIYRSRDGENFKLVRTLSKEELSEMLGMNVYSVEGVQLLKDPLTDKYMLFVSIDVGGAWDTLLITSDYPSEEWISKGIVLRHSERGFDSREARDPVIGVVDGLFIALYRACNGKKCNTGLAVSNDGVNWRKLGVPNVDGSPQPSYMQLCGSIFAGSMGAIYMGLVRRRVVNGCGIADTFETYLITRDGLTTLFKGKWSPRSPYEHKECPTHGYIDIVYDPLRNRVLMYVEAIDPKYTKEVGWKTQVDRWILYEVPLDDLR